MTALTFVLALAVVGLLVAFAMPTEVMPRSPIGETMAPAWRPHPRTVVALDPDGVE